MTRIQLRTVVPAKDAVYAEDGSQRIARVAQAGMQDRLWDFYLAFDTVYDGSFSEQQVARALSLVPSIDRARVLAAAKSQRIATTVERADAAAKMTGVQLSPEFYLSRAAAPAQRPQRLKGDCSGCLLRSLTSALRQAGDPRPTPTAPPSKPKAKPKPRPKASQREGRPRPAAPPAKPKPKPKPKGKAGRTPTPEPKAKRRYF